MSVYCDRVGYLSYPVSAAWHSCVGAHWSKYHCYKQTRSRYDLRCLKATFNLNKQTKKEEVEKSLMIQLSSIYRPHETIPTSAAITLFSGRAFTIFQLFAEVPASDVIHGTLAILPGIKRKKGKYEIKCSETIFSLWCNADQESIRYFKLITKTYRENLIFNITTIEWKMQVIFSRQASLTRQAFLITPLHGARYKTGKKRLRQKVVLWNHM